VGGDFRGLCFYWGWFVVAWSVVVVLVLVGWRGGAVCGGWVVGSCPTFRTPNTVTPPQPTPPPPPPPPPPRQAPAMAPLPPPHGAGPRPAFWTPFLPWTPPFVLAPPPPRPWIRPPHHQVWFKSLRPQPEHSIVFSPPERGKSSGNMGPLLSTKKAIPAQFVTFLTDRIAAASKPHGGFSEQPNQFLVLRFAFVFCFTMFPF